MKDWKRKAYLMHSETEEYLKKIHKTQEVIEIALTKFKKPYVAYSGGKDSTAMLYLILQECPAITVIHWDFGPYYIPRPIFNSLIENAKRMGAQDIRTPTSSRYKNLKRGAVNVLGSDFLGKHIPHLREEGFDLAFIGLRAEESNKRKARTKSFFKPEKGIMSCYPLSKWTFKDVWALIVKNNVPYLSEFYDRYGELLGDENTRFCTFFDPEFDKFGSRNVDGVLMTRHRNDDVEEENV